MKKDFLTAVLMTLAVTFLLGVLYPLAVTAGAQLLFHDKANGQLIYIDGQPSGSRLIGQGFTGDKYFHSRPSAAGNGYDAANSGASNFGPTNSALVTRVQNGVATESSLNGHSGESVPVDMVTASASGLDPDITPAAAEFQVGRVAKARGLYPELVRSLVARHTEGRQFGILGEPRVNVLELNLALDQLH